ncbi:MAG: hypothetical protein N5P05_001297 [Chroococcopsis gigantea SAG 12.99]|jgi:hypothetical protein|nr:SAM-dependent methyltransferase [Chlorogloea purpurea SAG 13.99]MDV2999691.1 hypothetical protein [Chroococcopsis gigantea SAG 12.99]
MTMKLSSVVPFGRSFAEYVKMFALRAEDLSKSILGVGDGPASFNAEATVGGAKVISIDPVYEFAGEQIKERFEAVVDDIIAQVKATPDDWVWRYHLSPEDLRRNRLEALREFLADFDEGKLSGRYQVQSLPQLNFQDNSFDISLCSHFLFLYSDHLDYQFHRDSVFEMLRVSKEVRIFPLLTLMLERSPYLVPLMDELHCSGYSVSIQKVAYEFQKGGDEMLKIVKY